MSKDNGPPLWVSGSMLIISGWAIGFALGATIGEWKVQAQAIKRGYAEYNATTGQWQWKGDKPEVTE